MECHRDRSEQPGLTSNDQIRERYLVERTQERGAGVPQNVRKPTGSFKRARAVFSQAFHQMQVRLHRPDDLANGDLCGGARNFDAAPTPGRGRDPALVLERLDDFGQVMR